MADKFTFVVEGEDDEKFLNDILTSFFSEKYSRSRVEFYHLKNNANELQNRKTALLARKEADSKLLIVLDADQESYSKTKSIVEKHTNEMGVETFLFPNNQNFGRLETLLRQIVPDTNLPLLSCIDSYKNCVTALKDVPLKEFDHHNEIFVYVDSIREAGFSKGRQRDYLKEHVWNLNSPQLKPLIDFLNNVFQ